MLPVLFRAARATAARVPVGARGLATGKDLRFSTEARNLMARGVDALADAVEVTLGPKGRNVVIERSYGAPQITKDGVTVAKNIEFKDKHMNLGAQLVRSVANDTNNIAGDGTTTATVLTRAIYSEGIKAVAAGMNPMDLKRGIDIAVEKVLESLKKMTQAISTKEEISSVSCCASASPIPSLATSLLRDDVFCFNFRCANYGPPTWRVVARKTTHS